MKNQHNMTLKGRGPYHLVIANNGHYRKRLNAMVLGDKGRIRLGVTKDDIGMYIGVKIWNTIGFDRVHESCLVLASLVVSASTRASVDTVAVNVHVVVGAIALEEDGIGDIAAVRSAAFKGAGQLV
ncbi:hypothetical protein CRV24_007986 [Beauveria bassiana]|nr:hypothetical protein CRV24_007986 [Beauveria bassiana]